MKLIDGKKIAAELRAEIKDQVVAMIDADTSNPHLVAVLVGEDPASQTYIASKEKACREVGIISSVYRMPGSTSEEELLETVDFINNDDEVHGLIVQLPLPDHIDPDKVINRIKPEKDVDGFHPENIGRMVLGMPAYISATPFGIIKLLEKAGIDTEGKHCVVLGRSNIVGTPVSILLSRKTKNGNATVTVCHSRTPDIGEIAKQADILIAAIGQQGFVKADMVKEGAVVIDVGIHRIPSDKTKSGFRLVGDVDFEEVSKKAGYITPVPGGVGPMTIVSLLNNTLLASRREVYP